MRKNFLYFIVIPTVIIVLLLYFFLDGWVESGLELAGESVVGAKVEIDNLSLTLSPLGAGFSRLQVANPRDPWKNVFETGPVRFAMDFGQLLRGKFIIETMEVNDLILATQRTTDGSLPKEPKPAPAAPLPPSEQSLSQQAETLVKEKKKAAPVFDIDQLRKQLNIDSLLDVQNLRSFQRIDSLKTQVSQISQQWQATLDDIDKTKQRAQEVEQHIKSINTNELKTIQGIAEAIKNVSEAQKGIKEISDTFNARKKSLSADIDGLSSSIRTIDDVVRSDFNNLLQLARLPDVSMSGLAELLLGRDVLDQANEYLYWVEFARNNIKNSSSTPPDAKPPRGRGQTIYFPTERSYPKFWIKKILISGGTDREQDPNYFYAKGEIRDICSNQRITGRPMMIDLSATQGRGTNAALKASFDRTKEAPLDTYDVSIRSIPIAKMSLGRSDFLPAEISNARASFSVNITVPESRFDANARGRLSNFTVSFQREARNTVERLVREVLMSVESFEILIRFWKRDSRLDLALETDLDNLLADRTRKVIGDEVNRLRADLRRKLDQKIAEKREELEQMFKQKKADVESRLKGYEGILNEKLAFADGKKKELEAKIEAEKKKQEDALKKKAGDALKNIFKKN